MGKLHVLNGITDVGVHSSISVVTYKILPAEF
jgi:hypothetical protein